MVKAGHQTWRPPQKKMVNVSVAPIWTFYFTLNCSPKILSSSFYMRWVRPLGGNNSDPVYSQFVVFYGVSTLANKLATDVAALLCCSPSSTLCSMCFCLAFFLFRLRKTSPRQTAKVVIGSQICTCGTSSRGRSGIYQTADGARRWSAAEAGRPQPVTGKTAGWPDNKEGVKS